MQRRIKWEEALVPHEISGAPLDENSCIAFFIKIFSAKNENRILNLKKLTAAHNFTLNNKLRKWQKATYTVDG